MRFPVQTPVVPQAQTPTWQRQSASSKEADMKQKLSKMEGRWSEKCSCFIVEVSRALVDASGVDKGRVPPVPPCSIGLQSRGLVDSCKAEAS